MSSPVAEPVPLDPTVGRYSGKLFPRYRFVPGLNPHPRNDPAGHSFSAPDDEPPPWDPAGWAELEPWLYAVDLFNHAYWWECHETLEGLWLAAGRTTVPARFVQGVIQVAAACLNRHLGKEAAPRQAERGLGHLEGARAEAPVYMGLDIDAFRDDVRDDLSGHRPGACVIRLVGLELTS